MDKPGRIELILSILKASRASTVQDLAALLGVSHMTVRRDLSILEEEGRVRLLYGAVLPGPAADQDESPYSLIAAGSERRESKEGIGRLAASLVEAGDALIVDSGSTAEYLARSLPQDRDYTLLCWALNIAAEAVRRRNIRTLFAGGLFHENTLMFESPEGLALIRRYRATKAFITASGVDLRFGITCRNSYERETKRAAIASSQRKILIVDSSKFGLVRSDHFAELSDFDELITDDRLPLEYAEALRSRGIVLRTAPAGTAPPGAAPGPG